MHPVRITLAYWSSWSLQAWFLAHAQCSLTGWTITNLSSTCLPTLEYSTIDARMYVWFHSSSRLLHWQISPTDLGTSYCNPLRQFHHIHPDRYASLVTGYKLGAQCPDLAARLCSCYFKSGVPSIQAQLCTLTMYSRRRCRSVDKGLVVNVSLAPLATFEQPKNNCVGGMS